MEVFKNVVESYEISNFGNVRKKQKDLSYKVIKGTIGNRGYKYFQLQRDGKRLNFLFHQYVAILFIGEKDENLMVDHIDRNKLNNHVDNLRYVTHTENMRNAERYKIDIEEKDPKKRQLIVGIQYRENNKELLKQKAKDYYIKNREAIIQRVKNNTLKTKETTN